MAAVEGWIKERLTASEALAEIGAGVYPVKVPQSTPDNSPAVTYRRQSTQRGQHAQGSHANATAMIEVRCRSIDYGEAKAMAEAVRLSLDSRQTVFSDKSIRRTATINEFDDDEAPYLADDVTVFEAVLVFEIAFIEEANTL